MLGVGMGWLGWGRWLVCFPGRMGLGMDIMGDVYYGKGAQE